MTLPLHRVRRWRSCVAVVSLCLGILLFSAVAVAAPAEVQSDHRLVASETQPRSTPDHSAFSTILRDIVTGDGFVRYDRLVARHMDALEAYIRSLEAMDGRRFAALSRDHRHAFWLNAYNAYTLRLMAQHPRAESIRELREGNADWAFDHNLARLGHLSDRVEGEEISLNDIEHRIVLPEFRDARIHFALVCAATSCPPLHREAFDGATLSRTLDRLTRSFMDDRRHVRVEGDAVHVSRLFEWFSGDFERAHGSARAYILHYLPAEHEVRRALEADAPIRFMEYDWSLNRPR